MKQDGTLVSLGTWQTKTEAEREALHFAANAEERRPHAPTDQATVEEWAERWYGDASRRLRPKTLLGYRSMLKNFVVPRWGDLQIGSVTRGDVLGWANRLAGDGYSAKTVRHAAGVLQRVLRYAVECEALASSPIDRLRLPTPRQLPVRPLTIKEVERLAHEIEHPVFRPAGNGATPTGRQHRPDLALVVRLAVYCGLRAAEVWGLRRGKVDLERGVLIVNETAVEVGGRVVLGPTKTGRTRAVPVPLPLRSALEAHLASLPEDPDALVFPNEAGQLTSHHGFYVRHFRPARERAGLATTRFHDLRHTYASLLIAADGHPRAIMERLGHSSINVTLGVYGHLFPTLDDALTTRLAEMIEVGSQPEWHESGTTESPSSKKRKL